jgi:hypothetical protein
VRGGHLEVLRGNRADTTTLRALLLTLKRRFGIKEAVFVFDGGMSSRFNLLFHCLTGSAPDWPLNGKPKENEETFNACCANYRVFGSVI